MAEIKEKAKPFFYPANPGSQSLALLIHGFTGSIYDLREIGEYLAGQGIDAMGVRLAGHGSCPEDLAKTTSGDWWQSVDKEIQAVKDKYQKIFLVGYSFGANLAIDFSVRYPDIIKSVILLGPSVYIRRDRFYRLMLPLKRIFFNYQTKKLGNKKELLEYEDRGGYTKVAIKNIKDFFDFTRNYTKKEASLVRVPTLIIQSTRDRVVHPKSALYVYKQIRSAKKELMLLDDHEHNPFFCDQKHEIFEKITGFLKDNGK
ncbi:alpha/beta fold hydrolase [Patescibacteria group bacterium]|nr:alpha/beta fold hydrolase [Patescibacteria group bacterium]MBU4512734.1 alpha/beta fold hydrolase [Patescibacteria group bacterium]MCG2693074.1 alpha/beta fold hydrolase [Candidatus Parcubacteria bacterium]